MENINKSKLMTVHLGLMGLLCLISIISVGIIFSGNIPSGFDTGQEHYKTTTTLYGVAHAINALALACGIYYLLKGTGKDAAIWYKAFVTLVTLGVVIRLIGRIISPGFGLIALLMIGIVVLLLALSFVKDLGEQKSWIIFYILLALVLIVEVMTFDKNEAISSIAGNLTRLVLVGSIGLALRDKYADKAARKGNQA